MPKSKSFAFASHTSLDDVPIGERYFTVAEIAGLLHTSVWSVYRAIKSGALPALRQRPSSGSVGPGPNRRLLIRLDDVKSAMFEATK